MSDQQILETAIQKAIDGGWTVGRQIKFEKSMGWVQVGDGPEEPEVTENGVTARMTQLLGETDILYDKGFAKALWATGQCVCGKEHYKGEVIVLNPGQTPIVHGRPQDWRYHLQQMVIAEDPIKYLGDNL